MPNYEIQISPDIKVKFYSDKNLSASEKSTVAVSSMLEYSISSRSHSSLRLQIANEFYRIKYQIIVSKIKSRTKMYDDAIRYIRSRKGIDFDTELADYAINKLLQLLDEGW